MAKLRGSLKLSLMSIKDSLLESLDPKNEELKDAYIKAVITMINNRLEVIAPKKIKKDDNN